jgi:K+-sensing histidine kinase KdpD
VSIAARIEANMRDDSEWMLYAGVGPLAAVGLGILLIPLRGATSAANFTFAFIVLTIVVAEYGGRNASVATALAAALSLDFFLMQPYLRLEIAEKHDVIAFLGLVLCGLVAAALGSERRERRADLREARRHRDLLHAALVELDSRAALAFRAARVLDASRSALPLSAAVLRDCGNRVIAASPSDRPVPDAVLQPVAAPSAPASARRRRVWTSPVPTDGGRLALMTGDRQIGWLDVWAGKPAATEAAEITLSDTARILAAMMLSPAEPAPGSRPDAAERWQAE